MIGFRKGNCMVTVLLKMISDTCESTHSGRLTLVDLLDISSAFHIADHLINIKRLRISYEIIGGGHLNWRKSFLEGRTVMVTKGSECTCWILFH